MFIKETQLKKWGNSQGIRIGKEELKELGYSDTEIVFTMTLDKGQIILMPKKTIRTHWKNCLLIMMEVH